MKKISLFFIMTILYITFGCELPKSITFTGSPTIELPGGIRSQELTTLWDIEGELDTMAADIDGLTRVNTQPGEPYELAYNREIVNIYISDFASENLNFDTINQTIDPQTIDIPSFFTDPQTISENIDPIAIPADVSINPVHISGIPELDGASVYSEDSASLDYSHVTFDSGTFQVHITITEDIITPGLVINLTSAEILEMDNSIIAATNTLLPINLTTDPTITFPLTGVTIPADFRMRFTVDITNGGGGAEFFDLDADFDFSPDSTISAASGIDFEEVESGSTVLPFDPGTEFVSAVIGTGQIDVAVDFPATWSNISNSIDITLLQNAVPIISGSGTTPYTLDLSGVTINSGDITVRYQVTLTGTDASFALDPAEDEITGSIMPALSHCATLVITPAADLDFSRSIAEPVDPDVLDIIESITFSNPVITCSILNELPFDIDISLDSSELELDPVTAYHTIPATGSEDIWNQAFLTSSSHVLDLSSPYIIGDNEVNIELIVTIPGYDSGTNELTLTNIVPGTSYSLSGNISVDLSLSQLVIASNTINKTFPDTMAGEEPLDFSPFGAFLPDTIDIVDIETILDISLDSAAGTLSLYLAAHYTDPATGLLTTDDLIGIPGTPVLIDTSESLSIDGLQDLVNKRPMDLIFESEITTAGAVINLTGTEEDLTGYLNISIPINLYAHDDSEILDENGDPIIPPYEGDLFDREEEDESLLLEYIDSVIVHTEIENNTGMDFQIDIEAADFYLSVPCFTGSHEIQLSPEQMEIIINTIPFTPAMHLIIPGGNHSVLTDSTFEISAWFEINTDFEYTIDLEGGKK